MASSKQVVRTPDFLARAAQDPLWGLATVLVGSFGVQFAAIQATAKRILEDQDKEFATACLVAGVNIRGALGFVASRLASVQDRYPDMFISGRPGLADSLNFSAMRAVGHLLAHQSDHALARRILAKSGSCITGVGANDSVAGKINKETAETWDVPLADRNLTMRIPETQWLNQLFVELSTKARAGPATGAIAAEGASAPPPTPAVPPKPRS